MSSNDGVERGAERGVADCRALAIGVCDVLSQLRSVVTGLRPGEYAATSGPEFAGASVGGHVRHCLDHVRAVVDGRSAGLVDYDHRERGTLIESDPDAAARELDRLRAGLEALAGASADSSVTIAVMPSREGQGVTLGSTIGRELAFVLSHTVHHNAMVRGMVVALGRPLPEGFGYAPSTLAHADRLHDATGDRSACAR